MANINVQIPWDGWELVEQIGRGQFGTVYKISSSKYGITEEASMKIISIPNDPQMVETDLRCGYDRESVASKYKSYLDDVLKEYQLMMQVKGNANIVRCDDVFVSPHDDGIGFDVYIRMEYLTSIMLVLPDISNENSVLKLGMNICNALVECEKHNILHRDIKPSNILISSREEYKLGDFGVSRTLEGENTYGTKGIGTLDFMAPEIYNGGKYGKEADIYSLGMVMYWLLNDRTYPFLTRGKAPTAQEVSVSRQKRFSGEKISSPFKGSDALVSIILKALAYDSKDRYGTAKEMMDDLVRLNLLSAISESDLKIKEETVVSGSGRKETKPLVETAPQTDNSMPDWNDSQETVGKDYSFTTSLINDEKTVGKDYSVKPKETETKPKTDLQPQIELEKNARCTDDSTSKGSSNSIAVLNEMEIAGKDNSYNEELFSDNKPIADVINKEYYHPEVKSTGEKGNSSVGIGNVIIFTLAILIGIFIIGLALVRCLSDMGYLG